MKSEIFCLVHWLINFKGPWLLFWNEFKFSDLCNFEKNEAFLLKLTKFGNEKGVLIFFWLIANWEQSWTKFDFFCSKFIHIGGENVGTFFRSIFDTYTYSEEVFGKYSRWQNKSCALKGRGNKCSFLAALPFIQKPKN